MEMRIMPDEPPNQRPTAAEVAKTLRSDNAAQQKTDGQMHPASGTESALPKEIAKKVEAWSKQSELTLGFDWKRADDNMGQPPLPDRDTKAGPAEVGPVIPKSEGRQMLDALKHDIKENNPEVIDLARSMAGLLGEKYPASDGSFSYGLNPSKLERLGKDLGLTKGETGELGHSLQPFLPKGKLLVMDEVYEPHGVEGRFVQGARVGPKDVIQREKESMQNKVDQTTLQGIAMGGSAVKGSANPEVAPRAGAAEGRPRTEPYGPELLPRIAGGDVKAMGAEREAVRKTLTDWAAGHPDNAAVAVGLYDKEGNVTLKAYLAGGNQDLIGEWKIGRVQVPPGNLSDKEFGDKIESRVRKLVGEVTGQRFVEKSPSATGSDFEQRAPQWRFDVLPKPAPKGADIKDAKPAKANEGKPESSRGALPEPRPDAPRDTKLPDGRPAIDNEGKRDGSQVTPIEPRVTVAPPVLDRVPETKPPQP
jgi:hypothetical protein